jgi:hypothetical protein
MTPGALADLRQRTQRISATDLRRPDEVVGWLGAVQAQDYLRALWAVGLRMAAAREADVERALADRTIVRTWPMRGTLHFVAAADARWMLALLATRSIARAARRHRELGLDEATFALSRKLLTRALQGGKSLSRPEVFQLLQRGRVATTGQRGIHILGRLAQEGLLCFGARQGKQQTFTLLEEWLPPARALARDEALAEIARRYFTGHGPATAGDLGWWTGLPAADVRAAVGLAAPGLREVKVAGRSYWMAPEEPPPLGRGAARVLHLLPGFDELGVGFQDRSALFDPPEQQQAMRGGNGMLSPMIVAGRRVLGSWRRTLRRDGVVVEAEPFEPLRPGDRRAFDAAAGRYASFLGLAVVTAR